MRTLFTNVLNILFPLQNVPFNFTFLFVIHHQYMLVSRETPSTCVSSKQKTPLARSFVPHHALNTLFHVYKTSRYVTMRIYYLQNTFSMLLSNSP